MFPRKRPYPASGGEEEATPRPPPPLRAALTGRSVADGGFLSNFERAQQSVAAATHRHHGSAASTTRQSHCHHSDNDHTTIHGSQRLILPVEGSCAPDRAIFEFVEQIRHRFSQLLQKNESVDDGAELELELRLGRLVDRDSQMRFRAAVHGDGTTAQASICLSEDQLRQQRASFVAGVDHAFFNGSEVKHTTAKWATEAKTSFVKKTTAETLVSTFQDGHRVIQPLQDGKPVLFQTKRRLGSFVLFFPQCLYDIRVSLAIESPIADSNIQKALLNKEPESQRHRRRTSFIGRDLTVDLTVVQEDGRKGTSSSVTATSVYEIEIELKAHVFRSWFQMEPALARKNVGRAQTGALWTMCRSLLPEASTAVPLQKGVTVAEAVARSWLMHLLSESSTSMAGRLKFPGTMPVGLARRHLPMIKGKPYVVSEKTDGVRYLMVVKDGHVVLVDRALTMFTASGLDRWGAYFPDGVVLDGEFVKHQVAHIYMFQVFDVLATGRATQDVHMAKPFSDRKKVLDEWCASRIKAAEKAQEASPGVLLPLVIKQWRPLTDLALLFRHITKVQMKAGAHDVARVYKNKECEHFTDGVVFCPLDSPYVCGSHSKYLKWKWSDLLTIDLKVELGPPTVQLSGGTSAASLRPLYLSCVGPENCDINVDSSFALEPQDIPKLRTLLLAGSSNTPMRNSRSRSMICEFAHDATTGQWRLKGPRPDKDKANYIETVLDTAFNMGENISQEELQYTLLTPHNDWHDRIKHFCRDLLYHKLKQQKLLP